MSQFDTYERLLKLAWDVSYADFHFGQGIAAAYREDRIDIEDVRKLIEATGRRKSRPSRATAYRQLEQWDEIYLDLANLGRGA